MSKPRKKKRTPKPFLALPDLEQSKAAVLNSAPGGSSAGRLRGRRFRTAQSRIGSRNPTRQRGPPDWRSRWELAHGGAGQAASGVCRSRLAPRQEESRHPGHTDRMRTPSRRVARAPRRCHSITRGALGHRRSPGQSRAHSYRSHSSVGEGGNRHMEAGQRHHRRHALSIDQEGW